MNDSLCHLSAVELAAAARARKGSPVEVTHAVLERINPKLNAFCTVTADEALATARKKRSRDCPRRRRRAALPACRFRSKTYSL